MIKVPLNKDVGSYEAKFVHGLRHTSATLLIAGHQDLRTVSHRMGHAQTSTTMNIYVHARNESDRTASDLLEGMLGRPAVGSR